MNIKCGALRHRIRIEQQVDTLNSYGETSKNWEEVGTYWAQIRPMSSRDRMLAQEVQSELDTMVIMRYVTGIKASMRAVHVVNGVDGTIYDLSTPIVDPDTGQDYMTLPAKSGLNIGG